MQRIVRGRSATLTHTFYEAGVPANPSPDAATVTITRDDGTALATDVAATEAGVGIVTHTLTPAQTAELDILTVTWTATFGGQPQIFAERVEIRGNVLFTIEQARRIRPLNDTTTYPTARIVEARTLAETALEEACGVPFVPTYFRERIDGRGCVDLMLPVVRPLTITSATIDGAALSVGQLAALELDDDGRVYHESGWLRGRRNIVVTGTHGYPDPPPRVSRAAIQLAKRFLVDSPVNDRATSLTTEDGTTSYLVTAGVRQAVFDVPEANAIVERYGMRCAETVG